jgi:hypothetical protein
MTTTTFDVRTTNLRALNSLTKYPSIPTYHQLDPKTGCLGGDPIHFGPGNVLATEKIDGTNSRIILLPDGGYLLGSRENLLYAEGDLLGDPALGIVEHLRPVADALRGQPGGAPVATVFYLELYGGKIGAGARQYAKDPARFGWRLFDVAFVDLDERLSWLSERIAAWRDGGGQKFADEATLREISWQERVDLAPRVHENLRDLPESVENMHALLAELMPATLAPLDDGAGGRSEGIVFRTPDRLAIAKARFQDYERTAKRQGGKR